MRIDRILISHHFSKDFYVKKGNSRHLDAIEISLWGKLIFIHQTRYQFITHCVIRHLPASLPYTRTCVLLQSGTKALTTKRYIHSSLKKGKWFILTEEPSAQHSVIDLSKPPFVAIKRESLRSVITASSV